VDDYLFIHLKFNPDLNVYLTASLLVAQPLPAYVLHGTKGTYMKDRTDIQETQLLQEVSPVDPAYGIEEPGTEGTLSVMKTDTEREVIRIPNRKSDYSNLFTAVYDSIRQGAPYPVKREEILWQLEILQEGK
jgi:predicted dehydrogenase